MSTAPDPREPREPEWLDEPSLTSALVDALGSDGASIARSVIGLHLTGQQVEWKVPSAASPPPGDAA